MPTSGDFLASDEEIDIEMFDSDVELSKTTSASHKHLTPASIIKDSDSDSDFMDSSSNSKPKRGSTIVAKRGGGRGRGRGRGAASGTTRSARRDVDVEILDEEAFDAPPPAVAKPRRGRPRKTPVDTDDVEKPKATRGRKKAVPAVALISDGAEEDFDSDNDDDDDGEFGKPKAKAKPKKTPAKGKARQMTLDEIEIPQKDPVFDPSRVAELAARYPDLYWKELATAAESPSDCHVIDDSTRIDFIDDEHPLELLASNMSDQMALTGMALSPDGTMLATFGSSGHVHIWDTDSFECLTTLRDLSEPNIDEFFVGQFTPNSEYLVVGGKLKDRKRWSEADEDNHILPCPLKVFNVLTGQVVARLEGHSEEILCAKSVVYKGENYFVTTSQDGYIRRWHMDSDWVVLLDSQEVEDGITCMAFTVSFVPNTGNRFFLASTDDHVTLMDLENCKIVQRFDPIYSSYCDCGKFIELVEEPVYQPRKPVAIDDGDDIGVSSAASVPTITTIPEAFGAYAYFVTRGVELLDAEDNTVSSRPNTCTLHRLVYPTEPDGKFELQEIRRYHHDEYLSNSWLIRVASNGRYILAPTLNGQVFVFSLATGQVTGILRDHDTIEVRDCKFHPTKNLMFTCSDDGTVKAYRSTRRAKSSLDLTVSVEDVEMCVDAVRDDGLATPQTTAVSPVACLKEAVESMAVSDNNSAFEDTDGVAGKIENYETG